MILLGVSSIEPKSAITGTSVVCDNKVLFSLIWSMAYLNAVSSSSSSVCVNKPEISKTEQCEGGSPF